MDEARSFKSEVEQILAKQALALNYEHGMTSRITTTESSEGQHNVSLLLDLTHSSLDFDMVFQVRFTNDPGRGISWELGAPEAAGGKVWIELNRGLEDFRKAVSGLPYFVQGFFAGRASNDVADATQVSSGG